MRDKSGTVLYYRAGYRVLQHSTRTPGIDLYPLRDTVALPVALSDPLDILIRYLRPSEPAKPWFWVLPVVFWGPLVYRMKKTEKFSLHRLFNLLPTYIHDFNTPVAGDTRALSCSLCLTLYPVRKFRFHQVLYLYVVSLLLSYVVSALQVTIVLGVGDLASYLPPSL